MAEHADNNNKELLRYLALGKRIVYCDAQQGQMQGFNRTGA